MSTMFLTDNSIELADLKIMSTPSKKTAPATVVAVPNETLLRLGGLFAQLQVATLLDGPAEAQRARGLQEGIVLTLRAVMDPAQFRHVVIQWEISPELLDDLDGHLAADDGKHIDV